MTQSKTQSKKKIHPGRCIIRGNAGVTPDLMKISPDKLESNCQDLGFSARCGNCGFTASLSYPGRSGKIFKFSDSESDDPSLCGEYLLVTCPNCGYIHKID